VNVCSVQLFEELEFPLPPLSCAANSLLCSALWLQSLVSLLLTVGVGPDWPVLPSLATGVVTASLPGISAGERLWLCPSSL
jgi:hypothetical protein